MASKEPLKKKQAKVKRGRKARLTTEIMPETLDAVRALSVYLQGLGYDAPMAKLVDRFLKEGVDKLKAEMEIGEIPKAQPLKALPGEEQTDRILPEGNKVVVR